MPPDDVVIELTTGRRPVAPRDLLLDASTLAGRPVPPRLWHVEGLIPAATVTLLGGDGGMGKSTLAKQLAVATVANKPWLGFAPRAGRVIYLSSEDDLDELHRRLDAACVFHGISYEDLGGLSLWPLADQDPVLAINSGGLGIEPTERWGELWAAAERERPALIVLDALADIFGGDENVRAQARQFVALMRRLAIRTGAAVLALSHPSLTGMSTGSGSSGSTAWNNSVRSRLYFARPQGDGLDLDPDLRVLSLKKANYSRALGEMRLRWSAGGFLLEDSEGGSQLDVLVAQTRIDRLFLELLDSYSAQGRAVCEHTSPTFAPAVFAKDPAAKGTTKVGFSAAMNRLFRAGEIKIVEEGPPSKRRKRIARADVAPRAEGL